MDLQSIFREAVADCERGATDIERRLIRQLLNRRRSWSHQVLSEAARLIQMDSTMANLRSLAEAITVDQNFGSIESQLILREENLARLPELFAEMGRNLITQKSVVVTISRSSAVEAVLVGALDRGWRGPVVVLDGTTSGCGTLQAGRLERLGFDVRSLPDGAMLESFDGAFAETLVLVGADAVGPRRIINAQGTGVLLEMAVRRRIHTAVVADSGKDVSEQVIDDLIKVGRVHQESGPRRSWPVFECFSRELVRERISEVASVLEPEPYQ